MSQKIWITWATAKRNSLSYAATFKIFIFIICVSCIMLLGTGELSTTQSPSASAATTLYSSSNVSLPASRTTTSARPTPLPYSSHMESTNGNLENGRRINLGQFNVPRTSLGDDFDQVYAANVQSVKTAVKKTTPQSPGSATPTPPSTPTFVEGQSARAPVIKTTPTSTLGHAQSSGGGAGDATQTMPPGEKIVLMCGPKAIDAKRYQRDYVVTGGEPLLSRATKNTTTSLRRFHSLLIFRRIFIFVAFYSFVCFNIRHFIHTVMK